ncbi:hypothetical protein FA13DRAFT_1607332, partial [Coprinellus micaceus]
IYGYAGCSKSAISQAVAEQLAQEDRLAASFFFFRGAGDRSTISQFAHTIAHQLTATIPDALSIIESAVKRNPGLLSTSTSSLSVQFRELVLNPMKIAASSVELASATILLDGLDEC